MVPARSRALAAVETKGGTVPADLALVDVRIRTLDPARPPSATAIAIERGTIVAVGDAVDVRAVCDRRTTVLSGRDWHVTPGLVDGHSHLVTYWAEVTHTPSLDTVRSLDELRMRLRAERERLGPDTWLAAHGLQYPRPSRAPRTTTGSSTRRPDPVPALIHAPDLHSAFANEAALRIAGITGPRSFGDGARVVCDEHGVPTGELREPEAVKAVWDHMPADRGRSSLSSYIDDMRAHNAVGLTGIHQMDGWDAHAARAAHLEERDRLTVRVELHSWVDPADDERGPSTRSSPGAGCAAGCGTPMASSSCSMASSTPAPAGSTSPTRTAKGATPMWPDIGRFRETAARFHDAGFRIATHAIGDRALREALDTYASFRGRGRHRVEHIELARPGLVERFAREGVTASMQPIHLRFLVASQLDPWAQRLGRPRCDNAYPVGDILGTAANVVLGSDWPVAPFDPRLGFFAAQRRFAPDASDRRPLGTSRPLTGLETLLGYTRNAAQAVGRPGGILQVGAPADLVAWGEDPCAVPAR